MEISVSYGEMDCSQPNCAAPHSHKKYDRAKDIGYQMGFIFNCLF